MDETFFISDKDAEHVVKLENDEEEGNALFARTDEVVPLKAEPTIAVTLATVSTPSLSKPAKSAKPAMRKPSILQRRSKPRQRVNQSEMSKIKVVQNPTASESIGGIKGIVIGGPVKVKRNLAPRGQDGAALNGKKDDLRKSGNSADNQNKGFASIITHTLDSEPGRASNTSHISKFEDKNPNSSFKLVESNCDFSRGIMYGKELGKSRILCPRCNESYFVDEDEVGEDDGFHVENKKPHECCVDKCGVCGQDLGYMTEKLKIRHIIYCEREEIPTKRGRALFYADSSKERKRCQVCDGFISNTLPSVEYSYYRRHCVAHVLPNPMEEQIYYYQCFYCEETFHHKLSFINHIFQHAIDEKICSECDESFPNNAAHFAHQIVHGTAQCPNCQCVFSSEPTASGLCRTEKHLLEHYHHCAFEGVYRQYGCGVCGHDFKDDVPEVPAEVEEADPPDGEISSGREWDFVKHIMKCHGSTKGMGLMRDDELPRRGKMCFVCSKNIACNKSIKAHAVLHVLPRSDEFVCRLPVMCCRVQCGRKFASRGDLFEHVCKTIGKRCCENHSHQKVPATSALPTNGQGVSAVSSEPSSAQGEPKRKLENEKGKSKRRPNILRAPRSRTKVIKIENAA